MDKKEIELPQFMKEYLSEQKEPPRPPPIRNIYKYLTNNNLALLIFALLIVATIYPSFVFYSRTSPVIILRV